MYTSKQIKKTIVAAVGFTGLILATILSAGPGLFSPRVLIWVQLILATGTSFGVFKVKNADLNPTRPKLNEDITKKTP
jgi:hypothetical protein